MIAEVETKPKNITAPAKSWWARAHVNKRILFKGTGAFAGPGVIRSEKTWPSYDIAETRAVEWCDECNATSEALGDNTVFTPLEPEEAP